MGYALNHLRGISLCHILPHVREDATIELDDLPAVIQLQEAAVGDPHQVATAKQKM
jgi:hypothetical protein